MKVKELVEKLLQFDQELEVLLNWNDSEYSFTADLTLADTITTCLGVDARYRGFYKRADDELCNPIYPDAGVKEYLVIT